MPALQKLIEDVEKGRLSLDDAIGRAASIGWTDLIETETEELVRQAERAIGTDPGHYAVSVLVAWAAAEHAATPSVRAPLALNAARAYLILEDFDKVKALLDVADAAIDQSGERRYLGGALNLRATVAMRTAEYRTAADTFRKAAVVATEFQDVGAEAWSHLGLAEALNGLKAHDEARRELVDALELLRATGDRHGEVEALIRLGKLSEDADRIGWFRQADAITRIAHVQPWPRLQIAMELATFELRAGNLAGAEQHYRAGIDAAKEQGNAQAEEFLAGNLGAVLADQNKTAEARSMLERALALAISLQDDEGIAIYRQNLRHSHERGGAYPGAEPAKPAEPPLTTFSQAEAIVERFVHIARLMQNEPESGVAQRELDRLDVPASLRDTVAKLVLERVEETEKTDKRLTVLLMLVLVNWLPEELPPALRLQIHAKMAGYLMRGNRMDAAADHYSEAARLAREIGDETQWLVVTVNLGSVLRQTGRTADALEVYASAVESLRDTTDPQIQGFVLTNASTAYGDLGRTDEAQALAERAVEMLTRTGNRDEGLLIATINLLTKSFTERDLVTAEQICLDALSLARELRVRSQEGVALGHMGLIRMAQGRVGDATRYLEQARRIAEETKDLWNEQHWTNDLANLYAKTGAHEAASVLFEKALELSRRIGDLRTAAVCMLGLGTTLIHEDFDRATEHLKGALAAFLYTGNAGRAIETANALIRTCLARAVGLDEPAQLVLGYSEERDGKEVVHPEALEEAEQHLEFARKLAEEHGTRETRRQVRECEAQIAWTKGNRREALVILRELVAQSETALETVTVRAQLAIYLDADQHSREALSHFDAVIAVYDEACNSLDSDVHRLQFRNEYAQMYMRAVSTAVACGDLDKAFEYTEASKAAELRRFRPDLGRIPGIEDLRRFAAANPTIAVVELMMGGLKSYAFVFAQGIGRGDELVVLEEAGGVDIVGDFMNHVRAYSEEEDDASISWTGTIDRLCEGPAKQLLAPVMEKLTALAIEKIIFIPHSILHMLPLHAVETRGRALIDYYTVAYSPAAALLLSPSVPATSEIRFAGIADTEDDLPFSKPEIAFGAASFTASTNPWVGPISRADAIRLFRSHNWIHVATHATQVLGSEDESGLSLGPPDAATGTLPLLSITDVARDLRLEPGSIVVLSACDTGAVTPWISGEYVSIAGAFILAGASRVIATQWRVDDACACLLVRRFYSLLRSGEGDAAAALRMAQSWTRTLTEPEAHDELTRVFEELSEDDRERCLPALEMLEQRRTDVHPYESPAAWGAFFLTGRGV